VTSKEIRRLEIDELLAYADTGEPQRVEAALELLRRRRAKQLRKRSKLNSKLSTRSLNPAGLGTCRDT
jgi:hypothetical protein